MIFYDFNGKIPMVILGGISGTGKDWIAKKLTSRRFEQVLTSTTRKKRNEEDLYNFISEEEMDKVFPSFIQKFESSGTRYGCSEKDIMSIVELGKIPILIVAPSAVMGMIERLQENVKKYSIFFVFIEADPEETFYNLTKKRGTTADEAAKRIFKMDVEINASFQDFLENYSYDFIKDGFNSFEIVGNSTEALEVILNKYYFGLDGEI